MRFLGGAAVQSELSRLVAISQTVRIAVAFWGQPAPEMLGLLRASCSLEVICNLKMGGSNPEAIKALLEAGINVLQSDHLHGKVYLFDNEAILGSSNASANGLSFQDGEVRGWHEANVLIESEPFWMNYPSGSMTFPSERSSLPIWKRRRKPGHVDGALVRSANQVLKPHYSTIFAPNPPRSKDDEPSSACIRKDCRREGRRRSNSTGTFRAWVIS
ncbi:phospholipase D family protein [Bradyrhizobium sp. WSM 1704]|nr:phospholipase D family protein [Bradyrhizobium semiaridum]